MTLLIDNYDSFSYNLYQYVGEIDPDIKVIRNNEYTIDEIMQMKPSRIIISPGPGRPENAGIIVELIRRMKGEVPILGVCLGHQAICLAFGAKITYAKRLMHGKESPIDIDKSCPLFANCGERINVARYHSLIADSTAIPDELKVTARTDDGEVMAVMHESYPVYGVQFHPESIMTPDGKKLIKNFISLA